MAASADRKLGGKYLTFALAQERYGLRILTVHEIIGVMHITVVPQSPHFLKGVINLRGKIIPVVDLRLKLGMPQQAYDEKTCIIVVECMFGEKRHSIGVVVDTVLEVVTFEEERIEPAPEYGSSLDTACIVGMGRSADDHVIILLDIERALHDGVSGIGSIADAAEASAA